jgi:hypothetical protein
MQSPAVDDILQILPTASIAVFRAGGRQVSLLKPIVCRLAVRDSCQPASLVEPPGTAQRNASHWPAISILIQFLTGRHGISSTVPAQSRVLRQARSDKARPSTDNTGTRLLHRIIPVNPSPRQAPGLLQRTQSHLTSRRHRQSADS